MDRHTYKQGTLNLSQVKSKKKRKKKEMNEGKRIKGKEKKNKGKEKGEKFSKEIESLGGIQPGTFNLEDHYFDHQAEVFQAFFLYGNFISSFSPGEPFLKTCVMNNVRATETTPSDSACDKAGQVKDIKKLIIRK